MKFHTTESCFPGDVHVRGDELVFNYVDQKALDSDAATTEAFRKLKAAASSAGEVLLSGFAPETLGEQLQGAGLLLLEDLNGIQMLDKFDGAGTNGLRSAPDAHIAHAKVAAAQIRCPSQHATQPRQLSR